MTDARGAREAFMRGIARTIDIDFARVILFIRNAQDPTLLCLGRSVYFCSNTIYLGA